MRGTYLLMIPAALVAIACGASTGAPATAETADEPASEPTDTAFSDEEAPTPEAADDEAAEPADDAAGDESAEEASEEEAVAETAPASPDAPPPSADLNAYVGSGAASPEYRTITANMDLIKRCYLDALRKDSDLQGMMRVKFTVNKKGKMIKAKAIENELTPEVAKCVVNTMKKLKFPKRADKRTVEYPFKFFPSPSE